MTDENYICEGCKDRENRVEELKKENVVLEWKVIRSLALHAEAQQAERNKIVEWLRNNSAEICDWSPPTIAAAIIDEEHWM